MVKIKKPILIASLLVVMLLFFVWLKTGQKSFGPASLPQGPTVSFFDDNSAKIASFAVELATTPIQQSKGLMYRESLAEDKGMLFISGQEKTASFWMKNTLIPLDMIFISSDKKVVSIAHNAQPCQKDPCPTYVSEGPVKYILEINGGFCQKLGIARGQLVEIEL